MGAAQRLHYKKKIYDYLVIQNKAQHSFAFRDKSTALTVAANKLRKREKANRKEQDGLLHPQMVAMTTVRERDVSVCVCPVNRRGAECVEN